MTLLECFNIASNVVRMFSVSWASKPRIVALLLYDVTGSDVALNHQLLIPVPTKQLCA